MFTLSFLLLQTPALETTLYMVPDSEHILYQRELFLSRVKDCPHLMETLKAISPFLQAGCFSIIRIIAKSFTFMYMSPILTFTYCKMCSSESVLSGRSAIGRKWKYRATRSVGFSEKKCWPWRCFSVVSVQPGSWPIHEGMVSDCVWNVDLCSGHVHAQPQPQPGKVHFPELLSNPPQPTESLCS